MILNPSPESPQPPTSLAAAPAEGKKEEEQDKEGSPTAPVEHALPHVPPSPSPPAKDVPSEKPPHDPYNVDHYLLTSSGGLSPFEQNLGNAPFKDIHGEDVWPALAYIEDGGVHPAKVI